MCVSVLHVCVVFGTVCCWDVSSFGSFYRDGTSYRLYLCSPKKVVCLCVCVWVGGCGTIIIIPYSRFISLDKNFAQPSCLCIAENIQWGNCCPCSKGRHRLHVIINTGQKIRGINISPMRAGGKKGENFLQTKISGYTVLSCCCVHISCITFTQELKDMLSI